MAKGSRCGIGITAARIADARERVTASGHVFPCEAAVRRAAAPTGARGAWASLLALLLAGSMGAVAPAGAADADKGTGAGKPGVGERAGRAIDETATKAGKAIRETSEDVAKGAKQVGRKVGEAVSTGVEKTGEALKKAGEKVEETAHTLREKARDDKSGK